MSYSWFNIKTWDFKIPHFTILILEIREWVWYRMSLVSNDIFCKFFALNKYLHVRILWKGKFEKYAYETYLKIRHGFEKVSKLSFKSTNLNNNNFNNQKILLKFQKVWLIKCCNCCLQLQMLFTAVTVD